MVVSDFLSVYGWYILGCIVVFVVSSPFVFRIPVVRYYSTAMILRLPIVGTLCRSYNLAQIARTLGLLLSTDVPLLTALDITATSTSNVVYRQALLDLHPHVSMGKNLSSELHKISFLFPALLIQMVQAGERTGTLPTALTYVSELYESDIRDMTKNLTTIVEPVLMLFMGVIVGFIAISIITPIYGITQNLHQ